jgi:hypothetical protein
VLGKITGCRLGFMNGDSCVDRIRLFADPSSVAEGPNCAQRFHTRRKEPARAGERGTFSARHGASSERKSLLIVRHADALIMLHGDWLLLLLGNAFRLEEKVLVTFVSCDPLKTGLRSSGDRRTIGGIDSMIVC